jgi:opacity protein-like surface antigen
MTVVHNLRMKRKLWMGVAVVAVLAGVTAAAVMAAQPAASHPHAHHHKGAHHRQGGLLAAAASYLGSTPAQLKSELSSGKSLAQIADATSGKSSQGLIGVLEAVDKQKLASAAASLQARITAKVDRPGGGIGGGGGAARAASSYLGVSVSQLRTEVRSGKTLAEIAKATAGKSEAGLIEALLAVRTTRLAKEVQAGAITQAQASARLPKLANRIAARVNRVEHARHRAATG